MSHPSFLLIVNFKTRQSQFRSLNWDEILNVLILFVISCRQVAHPLLGNWDSLLVEDAEEDSSETFELGHISIVKCISCHKCKVNWFNLI